MNRTLLSLAIIRTNWELQRKDYIENFVPLFATLIKQKKYQEISIEKIDIIKNDFKTEYGLNIPSNPIITILNRLSKKQLIKKENGKFIPVKENLDKIDITKKSDQIKREFEHVINALSTFIKVKHNIEVSTNELEDALICYLKKHDLDLLFAAERNSLLPKITPDKKLQYLINEFIGNAFRTEPQLFKFIVNLTIGHALSATILFSDFNQYSGNFKGLNLFFDTPFIFNLIGIDGIHKKALAQELVSILLKEGVKLFVLEITNTEVTTNLEEALRLLEKGKKDPTKGSFTFRTCLENGFNQNDVEQIILELSSFYKDNGINDNEIPNYDEFRDFQIDEEKLYDTIIDTYGFKSKKEDVCKSKKDDKGEKDDKINQTIFRDVQVLSGIYRYRLGNNPKTLKDCKYLFITTNSSLAFASRIFEKKENGKRYSLPTCLTDVFLGTLIWLHSPTQIEALSEKKIIADCFAALKPDEKIIAKYLDDVEKLKEKGHLTKDNYILLRTHRAAINILENKTLGDIDEFTSDTTNEILQELLERIKAEERGKLIEEKKRHDLTQKELDSMKEFQSSTLEILQQKEQEKIQEILSRNKRIQDTSKLLAKNMIVGLQVFLIVLLTISVFVLIIERFSNYFIQEWQISLSWLIFIISGLLNLLSGLNVYDLKQKLFIKLFKYIERKTKKQIERFEQNN